MDNRTEPLRHSRRDDGGISLQLRTNLFLGTAEMGEKILRYLVGVGDIFIPEVFDGGKLTGGRKVKFDPGDLGLPLKGWVDERYSLGIIAERHRPVDSSLCVSATDFLMFDHLGLRVDSKWFVDKARLDKFVAIAKDLYVITGANSGYIQNWRLERALGEITDEHGKLVGYKAPGVQWSLRGIFWANFFGPEYVQMFGRDRLLSAPWYKTEDLPDSGLLLLISESPFDADKPDYQERKKQIYAHLGDDAFTGNLLPEFRTDGRKKKDARPLIQSGGVRDDIFAAKGDR